MLMDQDALDSLAARTDEAEKNRSDYWEYQVGNFRVATDGTMTGQTTLGNVTGKSSPLRQAAHTILQQPFRRFGAKEFVGYFRDRDARDLRSGIHCRFNFRIKTTIVQTGNRGYPGPWFELLHRGHF